MSKCIFSPHDLENYDEWLKWYMQYKTDLVCLWMNEWLGIIGRLLYMIITIFCERAIPFVSFTGVWTPTEITLAENSYISVSESLPYFK